MKTKISILGSLTLMLVIIWQSCVYDDKTHTYSITITPQELPSVVPGFSFPEDSAKIYGWLKNQETESITKHAWGIWAGLTSNSNQIYLNDTLLIYETWLGISDIARLCANNDSSGGCSKIKATRERLDFPNQLSHTFGTPAPQKVDENLDLYVSVSYDPNASCFATKNLLLNQSTIDSLIVLDGIGAIKPFPSNSISIKPTYYIGKVSDSLICIPAWQGPADNLSQQYKPSEWKSYIYVDVSNSQKAGKIAVPITDKVDAPPATAVVNLNEFIHYAIDSAAAAYINIQEGVQAGKVSAGDLVILVCMHVATKEISNWTWQTFFWTTNPAQPDFPSSEWEAALRPSQLNGAASHYAVSTAYAMVWPNQPITGGTNEGVIPIIAYDPYLEPGLSKFGNVNKLDPAYQFGMQSNCMSCHAFATLNTIKGRSLNYSADQYVDMNDTIFKGWVKLDFAWSINANINFEK